MGTPGTLATIHRKRPHRWHIRWLSRRSPPPNRPLDAAHAARRPVVCQISEQPVGTGVRYIGVEPLRGVAIQCPSIQSTIPSTGSTELKKLALSRSRWTIPKPSAQCSKMPTITSGSPKEPENEQQDAGQSQSSCSIREIARELAVMGYSNKGGPRRI